MTLGFFRLFQCFCKIFAVLHMTYIECLILSYNTKKEIMVDLQDRFNFGLTLSMICIKVSEKKILHNPPVSYSCLLPCRIYHQFDKVARLFNHEIEILKEEKNQ